jgi:hypothetical protein
MRKVATRDTCAGEDLPPSSGDAGEGYQWEIQTNEGWVFYWDLQV